MKKKIKDLIDHLNHGLVERQAAIKLVLLTVLARENIVLVGPPGTGKSLIARRMAQALGDTQNGGYFEYLLTKFSTPDEIFGPLSISELKADRFRRNTTGYLPSVELAFLDEVFKASSSILNALLTILNERIYHNGADAQRVSLRALIAASNELPTGQEELAALYDRFLMRCFVDYVGADGLSALMAAPTAAPPSSLPMAITRDDIQRIEQAARSVTLPSMVQQALKQIWQTHREAFKEDRREQLSDRRLMKCLHLLRVSALTNGREEVDLSDVLLLKDCLWNHPDNIAKVRDLVLGALRRHSSAVPVSAASLPVDGAPLDTPSPVSASATQIPAAAASELIKPSHQVGAEARAAATGEQDVEVNGFCGRGTQDDPLLVQSAEDLVHMCLPEVGMQGYHFRQTKDIDCSGITTWLPIEFNGHFDGAKFMIQGPQNGDHPLFSKVTSSSSIENARLKKFLLASQVRDSSIRHCSSDRQLIAALKDSLVFACHSDKSLCNSAANSRIQYCSSVSILIASHATGCDFTSCAAGDSFIGGNAKDCVIQDCSARLASDRRHGFFRGELRNCSTQRCFVFGKNYASSFTSGGYGFAHQVDGGLLKDSVVGVVTPESFANRVFSQAINSAQVQNNYSIDKNRPLNSNKDGCNGQSIAEAMFTQRFFETHVKWDFKDVWQWDQAQNQPVLRQTGADAQPASIQSSTQTASGDINTEDLLTLQVRENIWL